MIRVNGVVAEFRVEGSALYKVYLNFQEGIYSLSK